MVFSSCCFISSALGFSCFLLVCFDQLLVFVIFNSFSFGLHALSIFFSESSPSSLKSSFDKFSCTSFPMSLVWFFKWVCSEYDLDAEWLLLAFSILSRLVGDADRLPLTRQRLFTITVGLVYFRLQRMSPILSKRVWLSWNKTRTHNIAALTKIFLSNGPSRTLICI